MEQKKLFRRLHLLFGTITVSISVDSDTTDLQHLFTHTRL
jgi:hypothetical protein